MHHTELIGRWSMDFTLIPVANTLARRRVLESRPLVVSRISSADRLTIDLVTEDSIWAISRAKASVLDNVWIYQEIPQYSTRTPEQAIRPSLHAALMLIKDEHRSALHHSSFVLQQSSRDARDNTSSCGFEHEQSIVCGLDIS